VYISQLGLDNCPDYSIIPFQDSRGSYPDLGADAEHIASSVGGARGERGKADHGQSSTTQGAERATAQDRDCCQG